MMMGLSESITDTVEPRQMLSLLARLGPITDREPALLLLRASATEALGRVDEAGSDIDQAVTMAVDAEPALRRRVAIESARAGLADGRRDEAAANRRADARRARRRREPDVRPRPRGARRVRRDVRRPRGPPARRRELPGGGRGVGVVRGVRPRPGLPARPGHRRPGPARPLRRGAGPGQPAAQRAGPVRRRALVDDAGRGVRPAQRQPPRQRRVALRPRHRPRLRPRQPAADRRRGVGSGARRVPRADRRRHAALDRHAPRTPPSARPTTCSASRSCATWRRSSARSASSTWPTTYLDRAAERNPVFPGQVALDGVRARRPPGRARRPRRGPAPTPLPAAWWRVKLVAALAAARGGDLARARRLADEATPRARSRWGSATSPPSARAGPTWSCRPRCSRPPSRSRSAAATVASAVGRSAGRRLVVMGEPISVHDGASR